MDNIIHNRLQKRNGLIRIISFSWMKKGTIIEIISLLYVILFLYTGLNKIYFLPINEILFSQSPIMKPFASALAWGVPITEFIVSVLLFFPRYRMTGLIAALCMMIVFTIYIIITLATSDKLPCSCGGIVQQLSWPQHIVFNTFFIALSIIAIVTLKKLKAEEIVRKPYL